MTMKSVAFIAVQALWRKHRTRRAFFDARLRDPLVCAKCDLDAAKKKLATLRRRVCVEEVTAAAAQRRVLCFSVTTF